MPVTGEVRVAFLGAPMSEQDREREETVRLNRPWLVRKEEELNGVLTDPSLPPQCRERIRTIHEELGWLLDRRQP